MKTSGGEQTEGPEKNVHELSFTTKASKKIGAKLPNLWGKAAVATALARKAAQMKSLSTNSAPSNPSRTSQAAKMLTLEEKVSDLQVCFV